LKMSGPSRWASLRAPLLLGALGPKCRIWLGGIGCRGARRRGALLLGSGRLVGASLIGGHRAFARLCWARRTRRRRRRVLLGRAAQSVGTAGLRLMRLLRDFLRHARLHRRHVAVF